MASSKRHLLTLNAGSSSLRLGAFRLQPALEQIATAHFSSPAPGDCTLLNGFIEEHDLDPIDAVAHRIVHGGARLSAPCVIDDDVEAEIERLTRLAPLHNPLALAWIRACRETFPDAAVQIGVFDTGFYAELPDEARIYALPRDLCERHGIRRYGFHGLAHAAMLRAWREHAQRESGAGRVISLQLGAGCSITASREGRAVDTSMGFSPLEGLVMATRCGDVDPSVLLYLLRHADLDVDALERLLNHGSGLQGVSGESADMRVLLQSERPDAGVAVNLYCRRARKYVGAYLALLGGADAILFGGGVGEHAGEIRAGILDGLEWAGIRLDGERNAARETGTRAVHAENSDVAVWVVDVDEARIMAEEALPLLESKHRGQASTGGLER